MKRTPPNHAFILTAGKGTRMRPYTDDKPKPMVDINGKPILEHTLKKLEKAGVENVTINLYYLGDRIKNYFKDRQAPTITFSQETELLETGGGVKLALHTMKGRPFYLINGDAFWQDRDEQTALGQLAQKWNPDKMDILLLLQPVNKMILTKGVGDYHLKPDNTITRTPDQSGTFMFTGISIVKPEVFNNTPEGAFSFRECLDKAEANEKLCGVEYKGDWHHISTPEDLNNVNEAIASSKNVQETKQKAKG